MNLPKKLALTLASSSLIVSLATSPVIAQTNPVSQPLKSENNSLTPIGNPTPSTPSAQTQNANQQINETNITFSPIKFDLNLDPGQTSNHQVIIDNKSDEALTYYITLADIETINENGDAVFSEAPLNNKYSLAGWIRAPKTQVSIEPNSSEAFSFSIAVPKDAEPGGHFGAVFITTTPPEKAPGTGSSVITRTGPVVLVRVSGDVEETLNIESLKTDKSMYETGPVSITARLRNQGSVHLTPAGDIIVRNMFGSEVSRESFNSSALSVLPGAVRSFVGKFNPEFGFGKYTVEVIASYGLKNDIVSSSTSFWIIPWKALSVAGLAMVVVVMLIVLSLRAYRRKIIAEIQKKK